jgi:D-lactate dehydrogenase (cytochrome)
MTQPVDQVIEALRPVFGDRLQTGATVRAQHAHVTTRLAPQPSDAVVFPETTQEVALIVKTCAMHRVPLVPYGTGTSLEGQVNAPEGGICLSTARMTDIVAVRDGDLDCTVQAGVTRKALNTHLRDRGLFFAVDPGADASLGGMASTRASGTNAVRYGTMKDNVIALTAVMADGEVIRTAARARKSSAGYDMTRLLIGAEGTLGVITELTLRLHGIPEAVSAARASFANLSAAAHAVMTTIRYGIPVARIELLNAETVRAVNAYSGLSLPECALILPEFHGSPASVAEQADLFATIARDCGGSAIDFATDAEERARLWQARHDVYWATLAMRPGATKISTDVCVPISRLADCIATTEVELARIGLIAPIVGHAGDGNFHVILLIDETDPSELARAETFVGWLNDTAIGMDGTCTGEHGIGQGKRRYLARELGATTRYMAAVKSALDPLGILNPGKILLPEA